MWWRLLPVTGMPTLQLLSSFISVAHAICCFHSLLFFPFPVSFLKKGAKEFVDQNILPSQRSRGRRRQQRPTSSSCPGPSVSAEEVQESDHETTTSSSGRTPIFQVLGLELLFRSQTLTRQKEVSEKVQCKMFHSSFAFTITYYYILRIHLRFLCLIQYIHSYLNVVLSHCVTYWMHHLP